MSEGDATADKRMRLHPEAASDFILAASLILIAATVGAECYRSEHPASISDLLVISITLSGITVPVCIAYLSLGRSIDLFSEIGDAVHFFMKKQGLTEPDLIYVKMLLLQMILHEEDSAANQEFYSDILALEEIAMLNSASGIYLSLDSKLRLVPHQLHQAYRKHFENHHDHDALPLYSVIVGVLAIFCILFLYLSHFGISGALFWALEHFLVITTALANLLTYLFLLDLSLVRRRVQHAAAHKGNELCRRVKILVTRRTREQQRKAGDALVEAKNEMDELRNKTP